MQEKAEKNDFIIKLEKWKSESENLRLNYDSQWAKNLKMVKGIYPDDILAKSKVRGESKLYFRKTWAITWRIMSSFYSSFLKDTDIFEIEGRDTIEDPLKAKILHFITKWRFDEMMRADSLFLKFIWSFQDIINIGICVGKFRWVNNETEDRPEFIVYPPEQVFHDMTTGIKNRKKYIIFENYLTKDEMEELGYDNIDDVTVKAIPSNQVRDVRNIEHADPLQNPGEKEYPSSGRYHTGSKDNIDTSRYIVDEMFFHEDGKTMFGVRSGDVVLKKPEESTYGARYPVVFGQCLTEAHKAIGEGFPQPLEGVEASMNAHLNQRKDNVALSMNGRTVVSRFGNVDLQSLQTSRAGGFTLADDTNAVVDRPVNNITGSSYNEAAADDEMMQEMSGITKGKLGLGNESKATVANINFSESNAKIDLFSAIVKETFLTDFFSTLAGLIQRFETNEMIFRIANDNFRKYNPKGRDIYDLGLEADCTINTGLGAVGRQFEIQQTFLAMDRANMSNQSTIQLLQSGSQPPPGGFELINTAKFMREILPKLGYKNLNEFFFKVQPPPQPVEGFQNQALAGANQTQIAGTPQVGGAQAGAIGSA